MPPGTAHITGAISRAACPWAVAVPRIAIYRVCVDPRTRQDVAAAAAVHRELGPDYEDAVAEGLIERIGAEVDKRVDARLVQQQGAAPGPARQPDPAGQMASAPARNRAAVVLGLGSMGAGILAALAVLKNTSGNAGVGLVVVIWIVIGIINITYMHRRR